LVVQIQQSTPRYLCWKFFAIIQWWNGHDCKEPWCSSILRHKVNCVCVLLSTVYVLLRLITLSCPCLIIFKLFVEFVASNFVTCKSFDSNFVCVNCYFSLCIDQGKFLWCLGLRIISCAHFFDFAIVGKFS
jgi:hypothetical protein